MNTYDAIVKQCDAVVPPSIYDKEDRLKLALQLICAEIDALKKEKDKPASLPLSFVKQLILGLPFIIGESELYSGIGNGIYLNPNVPNERCSGMFQILTAGDTLTDDMIKTIPYPLLLEEELGKPDTDTRTYKSYIFDLKNNDEFQA